MPNDVAILTLVISIFGTLLTNIIGKVLSKRQDMATVRQQEADAAKDLTEAAGAFIKPLREELDTVRKSDERNRVAIVAMQDELARLKWELRQADDALHYLIGKTSGTFPNETDTALKIRRGELGT